MKSASDTLGNWRFNPSTMKRATLRMIVASEQEGGIGSPLFLIL
jgi:hypothetical protein